ncbi:uncharacterized protein LOC131633779 [Vicia villosa]|uniref:uncharacterized protein LOC131633779 n=1 Tax=Vicia villosa TaxID=3911 RepID=UPI00273CE94D|nr:uncharacterized protein LOC131633779 [Vicia villosa]
MMWNCRGAASREFRRVCYNFLKQINPSIVVIMETRMNPLNLANTFRSMGFDKLMGTDVQGFAGGIALAWKSDIVKVEILRKHFQFLHLQIKLNTGEEFLFTPVYASPNRSIRDVLWEELTQISFQLNQSWLVGGDFNDILNSTEKKGGAPVAQRKCDIFKNRIETCNLFDLGAVGHRFTWKGPIFHGRGRIYERLDRAFANAAWRI